MHYAPRTYCRKKPVIQSSFIQPNHLMMKIASPVLESRRPTRDENFTRSPRFSGSRAEPQIVRPSCFEDSRPFAACPFCPWRSKRCSWNKELCQFEDVQISNCSIYVGPVESGTRLRHDTGIPNWPWPVCWPICICGCCWFCLRNFSPSFLVWFFFVDYVSRNLECSTIWQVFVWG